MTAAPPAIRALARRCAAEGMPLPRSREGWTVWGDEVGKLDGEISG